MFEDILSELKNASGDFNSKDAGSLNALVLAYIGDAVFEVYVRTRMIAAEPNKSVHKLHMMSTEYVKAHAQSDTAHRISGMLTDEELSIVRRGRNSKSGYVPKNADVVEYRMATGFEALMGYLYLTGKTKRLIEILNSAVDLSAVHEDNM
jgi:Uncharacterized protein conserved in bacteria